MTLHKVSEPFRTSGTSRLQLACTAVHGPLARKPNAGAADEAKKIKD
jgi:hypothetical protein